MIMMKNIWKFTLDEELPLNKMTEISSTGIIVRAVFYENNKYYPRVLDDKQKQKKQKYNLWNKKFLYLTCFLLITIALLITVSIYCYLIKWKEKERH